MPRVTLTPVICPLRPSQSRPRPNARARGPGSDGVDPRRSFEARPGCARGRSRARRRGSSKPRQARRSVEAAVPTRERLGRSAECARTWSRPLEWRPAGSRGRSGADDALSLGCVMVTLSAGLQGQVPDLGASMTHMTRVPALSPTHPRIRVGRGKTRHDASSVMRSVTPIRQRAAGVLWSFSPRSESL
jgi:hypothetical protein